MKTFVAILAWIVRAYLIVGACFALIMAVAVIITAVMEMKDELRESGKGIRTVLMTIFCTTIISVSIWPIVLFISRKEERKKKNETEKEEDENQDA